MKHFFSAYLLSIGLFLLSSLGQVFADAAAVPGQVFPNFNGTVVTQDQGITTVQSNINNTTTPADTSSTNNILGVSEQRLRSGNITMSDIPVMIASIITVLMGLAGSIAVVALIYHAVVMQINSGITGDSSGVDKAKRGMKGAGIGLVLALSAWFIMARVVELLSQA